MPPDNDVIHERAKEEPGQRHRWMLPTLKATSTALNIVLAVFLCALLDSGLDDWTELRQLRIAAWALIILACLLNTFIIMSLLDIGDATFFSVQETRCQWEGRTQRLLRRLSAAFILYSVDAAVIIVLLIWKDLFHLVAMVGLTLVFITCALCAVVSSDAAARFSAFE